MIDFKSKNPKIREVVINQDVRGNFLLRIGCICLAYTSAKLLISDLSEYLIDPEYTEAQYRLTNSGEKYPAVVGSEPTTSIRRSKKTIRPRKKKALADFNPLPEV